MLRRLTLALLLLAAPAKALAWADTGHRMVTTLAAEAFPTEIPAFLRTPAAVRQLGELSREPDRSKGSGQPHGADLDPGHFIDVDDAGLVLGGPPLANLPSNRSEFEKAVVGAGSDTRTAGYLPYSLMVGWQQLVKDFAYWRVARVGERRAATAAQRRWFADDRRLREQLLLRDLGYWSHYVADAANPMHVSVHFNGWGDYPNPNGYTRAAIHNAFEGVFVRQHVRRDEVMAAMRPYQACNCSIRIAVTRQLEESHRLVEPLYALWAQGGFDNGDVRGRSFATERLASASSRLRDLVVDAWRASAEASVGFPAVRVQAIEAGGAVPYENIYGRD